MIECIRTTVLCLHIAQHILLILLLCVIYAVMCAVQALFNYSKMHGVNLLSYCVHWGGHLTF